MKHNSYKIWTAEEEIRLRELFADHTIGEIAKFMCRSLPSVRYKGKKLGLHKLSRFMSEATRAWTEQEDAYIAEHYADTDSKVIAKHLNRTPNAVASRASRLGARKSSEFLRALNSRSASEARSRKSPEEIAEWGKNSGAGLHRCYQAESRRVLFGLPQKTKLVIRTPEGRKKDRYMRHLRNSFGYHFFLDTRWCLYYSDDTRRILRVEEYAERVYRLRFLPLSDRHS